MININTFVVTSNKSLKDNTFLGSLREHNNYVHMLFKLFTYFNDPWLNSGELFL